MKQGTKTQSNVQPNAFSINVLTSGYAELYHNENITVQERQRENGGNTPVVEQEYTYDTYYGKCKLNSYDDLVDTLVGLKYTNGDEIALMRKGIKDGNNAEYLTYIAYVDSCKAFARSVYVEKGAE